MNCLLLFAAAVGAPEFPNDASKRFEGVYAPLAPDVSIPKGTWGLNFDASLLVWQAREEGLEFVARNHPQFATNTQITIDVDASLIEPDFAWKPAAKVNLAFQSCSTPWDFDVRWIWLYSRASASDSTELGSGTTGLVPLWLLPQGNGTANPLFSSARGIWQIHFNSLDLEVGHPFCLSEWLSFRFAGGVKGLIIDQLFRTRYLGGVGGSTQTVSGHAAMKNDFWGIGPRFGFSSRWGLGMGWAIDTNLAGSLVLSTFTLTRDDQDVSVVLPSTFSFVNSHYHESFWVVRPNLECLFGLRWDRTFARFSLGFEAGYEIQYFWEQNMMRRLVDQDLFFLTYGSRGDLFLQGFTGTIRCGF